MPYLREHMHGCKSLNVACEVIYSHASVWAGAVCARVQKLITMGVCILQLCLPRAEILLQFMLYGHMRLCA